MEHTFTTRWGGLRGRYKDFQGAVVRCLDPIAGKPVQFARPLEYEAWIRSRFAADTAQITPGPTMVSASVAGHLLEARATYVVRTIDGREVYHVVAKHSVPVERLRSLVRVAKGMLATVEVHLLADLRADVALFWRLERLRQAATIHMFEGAEYDQLILQAVDKGARTRSEVHITLAHVEPQLLDARLAQMHCAHRIRLHFDTDDYGINRIGGVQ